ncbi:hypothetical protein MNV84_08260 [Leishmania braziliensis]|nr:hypothetical protein MNV84_08260 [Leishmania braziliensis]
MSSESEESTYTVHEVQPEDLDAAAKVVKCQEGKEANSPLARYYRLGTQERYAFDEHMRQLQQQAAAVERERQFRVSHPFQPKTSTSSVVAKDTGTDEAQVDSQNRVALPVASGVGSSSSPSSTRPVFDRLAAQAVQLEMRRRHREEQQRRAEAAALRGAFQPHINHTAPVYAERLQHLGAVPVEDRLLHYGELVARERQRKQELQELEKTMAWQSTQASLIGAGTCQTQDPEERRRQQEEFQARNARFLAERSKHRQCAEAAAAGAFSFHPKISATSAALDEARQRSTNDIGGRELSQLLMRSVDGSPLNISKSSANATRRSDALYALALNRQRQRKQNLEHNGSNGEASIGVVGQGRIAGDPSSVHQPLTNPTSDKWIAKGAHGPFFKEDFVRRQALYEEVKREEAALLATATQAPELGSAGSVANKVDTKELNQRLYYSARKANEVAERRRKAWASAHECPFRPQLSPGTKSVLQHMSSRDGDVTKRLTSQRGRCLTRGVCSAVDKEWYASTPTQQSSSQNRTRSRSQQRKTEAKSLTEGVADSARKKTTRPTESSGRGIRGASTNGSGDELSEQQQQQQQQRKQTRLTLTRDQVENFYQRQMADLQQRQDLIQERREGEAVQELVECTFRPRTNTDRHVGVESGEDTGGSVNHVTGVSEFLERQALARVRKAERDELLRTMGLPRRKGVESNGASPGTTVLNPFKFQTELRRQRLLRSPGHASSFTFDNTQRRDAGSFPVAALTTAERALHDAIEESRRCPWSASQAPLFPLPGYVQRKGSPVHFDSPYHVAVEEDAVLPTSYVPPSILSTDKGGRSDAAAVGVSYKRPSLFSLISPNTFSGRNLGAVAHDSINGKETRAGRDFASGRPSPSALKGSKQHLSLSTKRRRLNRSVSFVEETADASHAGATHGSGKSYADPVHLAFLSGQL